MVDSIQDAVVQHTMTAAHIHTVNVAGGVVFIGSLWAHMPTLAYYTASVGAVWYTLLAVRQVIQSYHDIRAWWERLRTRKG